MTSPNVTPPVLVFDRDYILPVSAKEYGLFGELQFETVRFAEWRMVDTPGQEWFVDRARKEGYGNPLYRLFSRRYRTAATGIDRAGDSFHAATCRESR